ncbi:hypothetical protein P4G95_15520 [Burkholderia vietnamiensis]|nr:hypothetical protein [Burkholderia vietnamiensis]WHU94619.1 hypothetical protein P4G95_15520 [Burkholderia vietnamiensis]
MATVVRPIVAVGAIAAAPALPTPKQNAAPSGAAFRFMRRARRRQNI